MPSTLMRLCCAAIAMAAAAFAPLAVAEEPAGPFANPLGAAPLDENALARSNTAVLNAMQLSGSVENNQAVNVTSGNNTITDGALSGANGLPMVIQNSGSNVLIQNATIVNVQLK